MTLRGEDKPVAERVPTHVRNKAGRIFIASPHLIERDDMTPIYDGDEEEIKNNNDNLDMLAKRGPPSHVRSKNGRVFIATPELVDRGDMEFLYDYKPGVVSPKKATGFQLSKATKQQIRDKGVADFDEEIDMEQGVTAMRSEYKEMAEAKKQDDAEVLEISKVAEQAMEEFGIILDTEVSLEEIQNSFDQLADSDEDFLNEIREKQADAQDDEGEDNDPDAGGNTTDEDSDSDGETVSQDDESNSNPDNKE